MKAKIHPKWNLANVSCACGNKFTVGSTIDKITVEVCSLCHPFYTGQMKYLDTKGRVDAFLSKQKHAKKDLVSKSERRAAKRDARINEDVQRPETLEELRKRLSSL